MWYNVKLFVHERSNKEKISIDVKRIQNGLYGLIEIIVVLISFVIVMCMINNIKISW